MPSTRNSLLLLTLAVVLGAVSIAAAAGSFAPDPAHQPSRVATQTAYETISDDMTAEAYDLEFLLIHVRLDSPAELGDQLAALSDRRRRQAAALGGTAPPSAIAGLVATLRRELSTQATTLAALATVARRAGPDPVRTARTRLRAQSERIARARTRLQTSFLIGY